MAGTLQAEEEPIDREIVTELVSLTPEWWRSVALEVGYSSEAGIEKYAHVISSPEGHRDLIDPSAALFDATYRLGQLFRRFGQPWRKVRYDVTVQEGKDLSYVVDFEY